jgi:hypothetical protein
MLAVKNIAARGTSVVCTIHQPSATIFGMFTHLLLLKKGMPHGTTATPRTIVRAKLCVCVCLCVCLT